MGAGRVCRMVKKVKSPWIEDENSVVFLHPQAQTKFHPSFTFRI